MTQYIEFPSEWHKQSCIQLTWPHKNSDWAYMLEEITNCFVEIAKEIAKREKLLIVCQDVEEVSTRLKNIKEQENLVFYKIASNDTWARDHGCISVYIDGQPTLYDFTFNGWGLKFAANFDNQINKQLFLNHFFSDKVNYINKKDFVLEGGSIESDGKGTILTTSECLLSPNRNAHLNRIEVEAYLKDVFGAKRILWLDHGYLAGDDTDSHIDTLARFCNDTTIAYVKCEDTSDVHYEALKKMEEQLKSFVDCNGNPYNLISLPFPKAIFDADGERLPATYANFLILNEAILLPVYDNNEEENNRAIKALNVAFPDKEIISVNCTPIIKQHGSLHCVTMQYPENFLD